MRSKTTVRGPSLSACVVIGLGEKRGLRGSGLFGVFVYVCSDFVLCSAAQAPSLPTPGLPLLQSKC